MGKKIVYVVGGLFRRDGMTQVLSQKINYLAENTDHELYIVLTENPKLPFCYQMSPRLHYINFKINFDELDTMPLYKKIVSYGIKQYKYKKRFSKYLMTLHPDITVSTLRREINFINSIQDGSKKIGEIHFNKSNYRQFNCSFLPKAVNDKISKIWMNKLIRKLKELDKFIVLSHEDKSSWTELENVTVIHNPLLHYSNTVSGVTSKKIIAVGRYTWQKGFDLLMDAWKLVRSRHPDWELTIYGTGNNLLYQKLAEEKGIGQSLFCKEATKNIYEKYQESSIFVLSSRYEGFGLVIAEAMSCGLPVVSFACPCGPKDIISDKEDGFLIPNGDIEKMAEKICYLIENENVRTEMGHKAHLNVERFKEEKIMKQWIKLFDKL